MAYQVNFKTKVLNKAYLNSQAEVEDFEEQAGDNSDQLNAIVTFKLGWISEVLQSQRTLSVWVHLTRAVEGFQINPKGGKIRVGALEYPDFELYQPSALSRQHIGPNAPGFCS